MSGAGSEPVWMGAASWIYGVLAVVWIRLVLYLIRQDLSPHPVPPDAPGELDTTRTAPSY